MGFGLSLGERVCLLAPLEMLIPFGRHTCWGITLSTASGHVLAELMLDGKTSLENIEDLDPMT